ncbi:MAG: ribose-phosphate diphosphokinase [Candidatus Peribacteria bacterium]|jgi:ribose-phosphate pyrophosphokinase|nr:ribose-phosphate diphosphokinase [Candidatus Peribacteria bacterium]
MNTLDQIRIMPLPGAEEMGSSVLSHLQKRDRGTPELVDYKYDRFLDGDGKIALNTTSVRNKIVFLFVDPYNYGCTYDFRGKERPTSPDEHQQNLHRAISAMSGKEAQLYIVSPLVYQARQDKRNGKNESLDMAVALNHLKTHARKLQGVVGVDVHNPSAFENALADYEAINLYPAVPLLQVLVQDIPQHLEDILVIGPDAGATNRARIFADLLDQSPCSNFHKRRDFSKKDTILEHTYNGNPEEVVGKYVIVPDDLIATGTTMLDVAKKSKEMGAKGVALVASHATFTQGIEKFDQAFVEGSFDKLYTTNGSYIPEEIRQKPRYREVDIAPTLADVIECVCQGGSTTEQRKNTERALLAEVQKLKQ